MKAQKRTGFWEAILNAILQALIAKAMGISPLEAACILAAPAAAEQRRAGEAHHGR
jgi:hypothetical protein